MKTHYILFIFLVLLPCISQADTFETRISHGIDDVEQRSNGSMYTDSTDLELVYDNQSQIVGLRFRDIAIPPDATITSAYIRFTRDEYDSSDCNLNFYGELSSDASIFATNNYNVSNRTKTTTSVNWQPGRWNQNNGTYNTPDLRTIVQEIIDLADWSSGNSMVFIITGSGTRTAESYEGRWRRAPLLHIEYDTVPTTPPPVISVTPELSVGSDSTEGSNAPSRTFEITNTGGSALDFQITDDQTWLACSPATGTLAAGSSITITVSYTTAALSAGTYEASILISDRDLANDGQAISVEYNATLRVGEALISSVCGDVPVYTENLVSPAILLLLDVSGSMGYQAPLIAAEDNNSQTPDLSSIIQQIINRAGWSTGNAMSFIITATGKRVAVSRDASGDLAALLHIEYDNGSLFEVRVDGNYDDAEESQYGYMNLTSTDLDFGESSQIVGLRFTDINIPQGANIDYAYIELVIDESDSTTTSMSIYGQNSDDSDSFNSSRYNITSRPKTSAIAWSNVEAWESAPTDTRLNIAKDVLSELVKDRSIAWGFGTWNGNNRYYHEYTRIHVGTDINDDAHQTALQAAISATSAGGGTPLTPSLRAGQDYFEGDTTDEANHDTYFDPGCQPKIVLEITDGLGNTGTTNENVVSTTQALTNNGISVVGVGFGLDDATQLNLLAQESNDAGDRYEDDYVYALHDTDDNGDGVPFLANSKEELITALSTITSSLKSQVFYGAAPSATTSVDYGNIVISAQFTPDDWSGDLVATEYTDTGTLGTVRWSASEQMPNATEINAFTLDNLDNVVAYDETTFYPFYTCKPLGDIIHSTPKVVGNPAYYYSFDNYYSFQDSRRGRNKLVYVGANDGALHAFSLETGIEQWRFYPKSLQNDLNSNLVDTNEDLCYATRTPSGEYCHKYLVDGTPIAADVYDGSSWRTVLVTGLGKGGAAYFSLDISGGEPFGAEDDSTKYLWEFTDSELGFATSEPAIGRVVGTSSPQWGVFFGSGFSEVSQQDTKEAYLFGFKAVDQTTLWLDSSGTPIKRIKISSTTLADDALSSPLIVNIGDDYIDDRLYVGNLYGTMYRIANIGEGQTPIISKLLDLGRSGHENAITATATYAYDQTYENVWIYFGTGKYEETTDKTTMDQQYFFGLCDNKVLRASSEITGSATYFWNAATNTLGSPSQNIRELATRKLTATSEDGTINSYRVLSGCDNQTGSWLLKLLYAEEGMIGSERVTSKPIVIAGVVFFTTFIPDTDVCAGNGEAWLYALDYTTGCPVNVFDINGDGNADDNDKVTDEETDEEYTVIGVNIGNGEASDLTFDGKFIWYNTTVDGSESGKTGGLDLSAALKAWRQL